MTTSQSHDAARGLALSGVTVSFGERQVLSNLTLSAAPGESLSIMGRSGCGKSTLLSVISGLIKPTAGEVLVAGRRIDQLTREQAAQFRGSEVGIVFQTGELLPDVSALENIAIAGVLAGRTMRESSESAMELLSSVGIEAPQTLTRSLSGGERARVAIARALMGAPSVILADEPTGSLDAELRDGIQELLYSLPQQRDCVLIVVTHDPAVAAGATRGYQMVNGQLSATATTPSPMGDVAAVR